MRCTETHTLHPHTLPACRYYDLEELRRVFGWVADYIKSPPGRYHDALQPGDLSQTGQVRASTASLRDVAAGHVCRHR